MADAAAELPDDLLPPEVLVDEVPLTDDDLDEFAELVAKVADSVGCSREEAVELLWEPPEVDGEDGVYDEDGNLVATLPPAVRAAGELDESKADWAMARFAQAEAAIKAAKARHTVLVERLARWREQALKRPESDKAYFSMILTAYGLAQRDATGTATFTMPSGKLATRAKNKGGGLAITDADTVAEWLRTSVGAEFLEAAIEDTVDELYDGIVEDSGLVGDVMAIVTKLVEKVLTADPYEGALNAKGEPLVSKLGQHLRIDGDKALDLVSGDPVPGVKVVPESVGVTITPN